MLKINEEVLIKSVTFHKILSQPFTNREFFCNNYQNCRYFIKNIGHKKFFFPIPQIEKAANLF